MNKLPIKDDLTKNDVRAILYLVKRGLLKLELS